MATQASPQQSTQKNRKLMIDCAPTLDFTGIDRNVITGTMEYTPVGPGTVPPMDHAVGANGNIDLLSMPDGHGVYNSNIDITLRLDTSKIKGPDGKPIKGKVRWALAGEGRDPDLSRTEPLGFGWFCATDDHAPLGYVPLPKTEVKGMTFVRDNDQMLTIKDNRQVTDPACGYCMAIALEGYGNYYMYFDPMITAKGTGINRRDDDGDDRSRGDNND